MSIDPKKAAEQGYDQVALDYERLEGERKWPRMRWLGKVLDMLSPGASVLDLGCGSGAPADIEIAKGHQVTGVDISGRQVELARRNVPTGRFLKGDVGSVEFAVGSFDAVVSFYVLDGIPRSEHELILGRVYEWLRPGGLFLVSIEARDYEDQWSEWLGVPMFFSSFDPLTFRRLVEGVGFEVLETDIEGQIEMYEPEPREVRNVWVLARKTLA